VNADDIIMWFDAGGALQVNDDVNSEAVVGGFRSVPGLLGLVEMTALAEKRDLPLVAAACELILESLVARKKISRTDAGLYGRSHDEKRRRPYAD
jgi:magnesium chelatase subunit I